MSLLGREPRRRLRRILRGAVAVPVRMAVHRRYYSTLHAGSQGRLSEAWRDTTRSAPARTAPRSALPRVVRSRLQPVAADFHAAPAPRPAFRGVVEKEHARGVVAPFHASEVPLAEELARGGGDWCE